MAQSEPSVVLGEVPLCESSTADSANSSQKNPPVNDEAAPKMEEAPKKEVASKKEGKKKAGGKQEAPKEKSEAELAEERKTKVKKVMKEGGKRGVEIEGAADMGGLQFFCTSVDEPEGDLALMDMCMEAMNKKCDPSAEERSGGSGAIGKMIFSAGNDQLGVVAYIPEAKQGEIDATEWLKKVLDLFQGEIAENSTATYARGFVTTDTNINKFPLKMKEPSITEAISYLKSKGLFPDNDSDSDDFVFGDDDFPS